MKTIARRSPNINATLRNRVLSPFLAVLLALLPGASSAFAWGRTGHHIVALLAESRLTPEAKQKLGQLLTPPETLASISTWPDEIRPDHPETAGWHYVSIPRSAPFFEKKRDCYQPDPAHPGSDLDQENCVVARIDSFARLLADTRQPKSARVDALKYLVHFVGDLHQPMHALEEGRGGNEIKVVQFGSAVCGGQNRPCNLHALWDSGLIDHTHRDENAYVLLLQSKMGDLAALPQGTPADWANESHRLAEGALLPNGGVADEIYFDHEVEVVDCQLQLAGLRLAHMLNACL